MILPPQQVDEGFQLSLAVNEPRMFDFYFNTLDTAFFASVKFGSDNNNDIIKPLKYKGVDYMVVTRDNYNYRDVVNNQVVYSGRCINFWWTFVYPVDSNSMKNSDCCFFKNSKDKWDYVFV